MITATHNVRGNQIDAHIFRLWSHNKIFRRHGVEGINRVRFIIGDSPDQVL